MDCENCVDCEVECQEPQQEREPGFHTEMTRDAMYGNLIEYPRKGGIGFEFDILTFSDGWKYLCSYASVTEGSGKAAVDALKNIQHSKNWRVVNAFTGLIVDRK